MTHGVEPHTFGFSAAQDGKVCFGNAHPGAKFFGRYAAVSYTHLDVYKRQGLNGFPMSCIISSVLRRTSTLAKL